MFNNMVTCYIEAFYIWKDIKSLFEVLSWIVKLWRLPSGCSIIYDRHANVGDTYRHQLTAHWPGTGVELGTRAELIKMYIQQIMHV